MSAINSYILLINFFAHSMIFTGAFYVAIHNRRLPQWHITPLWYIGLASLACAITILIQWGMGPSLPFSYNNIGNIVETVLNVCLAVLSSIFLFVTIKADLRGIENRKK